MKLIQLKNYADVRVGDILSTQVGSYNTRTYAGAKVISVSSDRFEYEGPHQVTGMVYEEELNGVILLRKNKNEEDECLIGKDITSLFNASSTQNSQKNLNPIL